MKVAVLYTGALRTIRKTITYFKKHVLLHPTVHIYACVQNDTSLSNSDIESWMRHELSPHLISIQWFTINDYSEFVILREKNLTMTTIPNKWKDYLRSSGSIIEYLQLQLVYKQMFLQEQLRNMEYDYVIRMRPDNLFAKSIDFHWLQWTEQEIETRVEKIHQQMTSDGLEINPDTTLRYFMNTLLDDQLVPNIKYIIGEFVKNKRVSVPSNCKELHQYLHHGSYILTYRSNNLYIIRRDLFHMIPSIFSMYGLLKTSANDPYWFNAENQFQYACIYSGLAIHDYNTILEDKSLYEYDETRYFDNKFQLINPHIVYCLVRT